jgi:hypothetical protein
MPIVKGKSRKYLCKCDCGNEKAIIGSSLRTGNTSSCGCYRKEKFHNDNFDNSFNGKKINMLTIGDFVKSEKGRAFVNCRCDCGKEKNIRLSDIKNGKTRSCGCYIKQITAARSKTHGASGSRLCRIFRTMKTRCYNPKNHKYHRYGARGIEICPEWKDSFSTFLAWALNNGYEEHLTIERKDNDGNYSPENCRWATPKEQSNNNSRNVLLTHNGRTQNITQWATELNMPYRLISGRIKLKWDTEKILTTPSRNKNKRKRLT